MTTPSPTPTAPRRLFSLSLAVLLFLPAVPASAGDGGIDLRLEEALALQGATFEFGESELTSQSEPETPAVPTSDLGRADLMDLADSPRVAEAAVEHDLGDRARGGGFGRWLKKYWYIPVLAAAAVVALADDGSDGPEDVED